MPHTPRRYSREFMPLRQRGFSLLELMAVLAILSIVMAVVMTGVAQLQRKATNESQRVDLTQESRQFMDQIVKDLHHAGYPNARMFDAAVAAANPTYYGDGIMQLRPGYLQFEGDVDGTGTVSEVFVQLVPELGPCPCTLQRGTTSKANWLAGAVPLYYTQVDNVMNTNIFTALHTDGTNALMPCGPKPGTPSCADGNSIDFIKSVGLTLNVRSLNPDMPDKAYMTVTMSSDAKISNLKPN